MPPFVLVDGSYYLFRAFHALPPMTTRAGLHTNAVKGALSALQKLIRRFEPTHMVVVFDTPEPTFRHLLSADYKAHRPEMPSDLSVQIPYLHAVIQALGIPLLLLPGAEADDLIGTLAKTAEAEGHQVMISTGDKDMAQLVNDNIILEDSFRDRVMDFAGVVEKFGVRPDQIRDYLTLMGDASDGISGIPGIGAKTAAKLLQEYNDIPNLLAHADDIKGKVGENLRNNAALIPLNHQLATIVCDLPLNLNWHDMKVKAPDNSALSKLYTELEFRGLLQSLGHPNHPDNPLHAAAENNSTQNQALDKKVEFLNAPLPTMPQHAHAETTTGDNTHYTTILEQAQFDALLLRLRAASHIAVDIETTYADYRLARVVGISLCIQAHEAFYIPVGHGYDGAPVQLDTNVVLTALKPLLESTTILKIGHFLKYDAHVLQSHGITLKGWGFDTMLASYVLNPTSTRHTLDILAQHYLNHRTTTLEDIAGKGVKQLNFNDIALSQAAPYSCENVDLTWQLFELFTQLLSAQPKLLALLTTVELPVAQILWQMEAQGIMLNTAFLATLGSRFGSLIADLEIQAHTLAGKTFNVASPKQTGEILFETLGLKGGKKTASGQYGTSEAVLEKIDHPLAELLLEYRGLAKLKNTYTDRLIAQCHRTTNRVHTSYNQAVTATGRLSSTDPNLQNIPIRGETGRLIRQAFIAPPHHVLLAADYSQIELRLMAHFSKDDALLEAFNNNRDVHQATAAEVLGIALDEVSSDQRRQAKAINFGLLYGMSSFGLAKQLKLTRGEAQAYIDTYFTRYPGVRYYMHSTRQFALENGFVETLLGRRLYTPDISSSNAIIRQAAERAAINAPLQGSAADIIKLAMIAVNPLLPAFGAHMLLQVHDELVFEVPSEHAPALKAALTKHMSAVVTLDVPLLVDIGQGLNWNDAH